MKHPGGVGSEANHKRDYCNDGVRPTLKNSSDSLPPWPQPDGIFTRGAYFNPVAFLATLKTLCERLHTIGNDINMLEIEYQKLWTMFRARTIVREDDGVVLFRLFDFLTLSPHILELVVLHGKNQYLKILCLPATSANLLPHCEDIEERAIVQQCQQQQSASSECSHISEFLLFSFVCSLTKARRLLQCPPTHMPDV